MEKLKIHLIDLYKQNGSLFLKNTKQLKAIIDKEYPETSKNKILIGISLIEEIPERLATIYSYQNLTSEPTKYIYRLKALKIQLKNKYFLNSDEVDFIIDFWAEICCYDKLIPKEREGVYGYENYKGELIVDYKYDKSYQFNEGLGFAKTKQENDKYVCIDNNGDEHFTIQTDFFCSHEHPRFSDGLVLVSFNNKYFFLNKFGKTILAIDEKNAQPFSEGLAYVSDGRKSGFINKFGEMAIPMIYDFSYEITGFKNGLISIKKNNRAGVIDTDNNIVIPFNYQHVGPFIDGIALTVNYEKYNYIDINNNIIIPHIKDCFWAGDFSDGLAPISIRGKTGFIDKTGKFVIPPTYCFDTPYFVGGIAQAFLTPESYYTNYIDKQGNVLSGEWG